MLLKNIFVRLFPASFDSRILSSSFWPSDLSEVKLLIWHPDVVTLAQLSRRPAHLAQLWYQLALSNGTSALLLWNVIPILEVIKRYYSRRSCPFFTLISYLRVFVQIIEKLSLIITATESSAQPWAVKVFCELCCSKPKNNNLEQNTTKWKNIITSLKCLKNYRWAQPSPNLLDLRVISSRRTLYKPDFLSK